MRNILLYIGATISGLIGAAIGGVTTAYIVLAKSVVYVTSIKDGNDWVPFLKAVILFFGVKILIFVGAVVLGLIFAAPFIALTKSEGK